MWSNQIEFLMSCIATSVGLGNVWRFPFVAYQNGGGAFLIPYIIVLFLVGKPMYYLECVLGQFSSRNSVKVWSLSPAMKGKVLFSDSYISLSFFEKFAVIIYFFRNRLCSSFGLRIHPILLRSNCWSMPVLFVNEFPVYTAMGCLWTWLGKLRAFGS